MVGKVIAALACFKWRRMLSFFSFKTFAESRVDDATQRIETEDLLDSSVSRAALNDTRLSVEELHNPCDCGSVREFAM